MYLLSESQSLRITRLGELKEDEDEDELVWLKWFDQPLSYIAKVNAGSSG
jgi:hypothetical protein